MENNRAMWDLCCGKKGASLAMVERGWRVLTLDNNAEFNPIICTDICTWKPWQWMNEDDRPDLIWCSPPCTEFAREFMPWCATGQEPDLTILKACVRIIREVQPRYWVIENVKGALNWFLPILGKPAYVCNPYYLWGSFPDISHVKVTSHKERLSSSKAAERGIIPHRISEALAMAIEQTVPLVFL